MFSGCDLYIAACFTLYTFVVVVVVVKWILPYPGKLQKKCMHMVQTKVYGSNFRLKGWKTKVVTKVSWWEGRWGKKHRSESILSGWFERLHPINSGLCTHHTDPCQDRENQSSRLYSRTFCSCSLPAWGLSFKSEAEKCSWANSPSMLSFWYSGLLINAHSYLRIVWSFKKQNKTKHKAPSGLWLNNSA